MFFFAGLRLFRFAQYAFAAAAIARRAIRLRGCGYFASLNTPSLPAYLLCKYGRLGAAMFSLRCEHTPRFFRYFAHLLRRLRISDCGNARAYAPFRARRLAFASNCRKKIKHDTGLYSAFFCRIGRIARGVFELLKSNGANCNAFGKLRKQNCRFKILFILCIFNDRECELFADNPILLDK